MHPAAGNALSLDAATSSGSLSLAHPEYRNNCLSMLNPWFGGYTFSQTGPGCGVR